MTDQPTALDLTKIPKHLPDHPHERGLRRAEQELAVTLRKLTRQVADSLEHHRRHDAVVGLANLEVTAQAAKRAMARAIQDQMDAAVPPSSS